MKAVTNSSTVQFLGSETGVAPDESIRHQILESSPHLLRQRYSLPSGQVACTQSSDTLRITSMVHATHRSLQRHSIRIGPVRSYSAQHLFQELRGAGNTVPAKAGQAGMG